MLTDTNTKFTYHITVNGPKPLKGAGVLINGVVDEKASGDINDFIAKRSAPTDFWGEYTLVKN